MCFDILYKVFLKHFLFYENWVKYDKNVNCYHSKVPVILVRFEWNLNFKKFSENIQILIFMKICTLETESFHLDGSTDG